MIPHLTSFRVVAQDLPGHGRSSIPRLSVADAIADADAVVTDLGLGDPILAGFSLGGWAALHYAAWFFGGIGVGAHGLDRGLLAPGGRLARRWWAWLIASVLGYFVELVLVIDSPNQAIAEPHSAVRAS